jgi:SAM-dependent methyltransferase
MHHHVLRAHWNNRVARERERETAQPGKRVHTDLLWREIHRTIGERTGLRILDAGAGTGRFSLPLAEAGHAVTHLDIAPAMLEAARAEAEQNGITTVTFVEGSVDDLSIFPNASFDLVLCLDSPLSFCGNRHEAALAELIRVCRGSLILCVVNTLGVITEGGLNFDLEQFGELRTVLSVFQTGVLDVSGELRQVAPTLMPTWKSFRPAELKALLEAHGCVVTRVSAPGTLARFIKPELLTQLFANVPAYRNFLDFEEQFDAEESVLGLGAVRAGGLMVTACKTDQAQSGT